MNSRLICRFRDPSYKIHRSRLYFKRFPVDKVIQADNLLRHQLRNLGGAIHVPEYSELRAVAHLRHLAELEPGAFHPGGEFFGGHWGTSIS